MTSCHIFTNFNMKTNSLHDTIQEEILSALKKETALSVDDLLSRCLSAEYRLQLIRALKSLVDAGVVKKTLAGTYRATTETEQLFHEVTHEVKPKKARMKMSGNKIVRPPNSNLSTHAIRQYYDSSVIEQSDMLMTLLGLRNFDTAAFSRQSVIGRLAFLFYIYQDRVIYEKDFNELLTIPVQNYRTVLNRLCQIELITTIGGGYQWTGKVIYPFRVRVPTDDTIVKTIPVNFSHGLSTVEEIVTKNMLERFSGFTYGDKEIASFARIMSSCFKNIRAQITQK